MIDKKKPKDLKDPKDLRDLRKLKNSITFFCTIKYYFLVLPEVINYYIKNIKLCHFPDYQTRFSIRR